MGGGGGVRTKKVIEILAINDTLIKSQVHNHTIVIYIQYKFHKISSIDYKNIMAEDGKKSLKLGNQTAITPL